MQVFSTQEEQDLFMKIWKYVTREEPEKPLKYIVESCEIQLPKQEEIIIRQVAVTTLIRQNENDKSLINFHQEGKIKKFRKMKLNGSIVKEGDFLEWKENATDSLAESDIIRFTSLFSFSYLESTYYWCMYDYYSSEIISSKHLRLECETKSVLSLVPNDLRSLPFYSFNNHFYINTHMNSKVRRNINLYEDNEDM